MKKTIVRMSSAAVVLLVMIVFMMTLNVEESSAKTFTKVIPKGKQTEVSFGTSYEKNTVFYKIKPTKTGYVTFSCDYSGYAVLCNGKKKVISKGTDTDGEYVYSDAYSDYDKVIWFGVTKGKVYYIRVKGYPSNRYDDGNYYGIVKWTNTKFKPGKYGKSKKKARAIKRKKLVKGMFKDGNTKPQWYKVTTRQKNTHFIIKSINNNYGINFKVYYKSYGHWYDSTRMLGRGALYNIWKPVGETNKKYKHTYYIKVYPEKKTSGTYTIKWK